MFWTLLITILSLISGDSFSDVSIMNIAGKDKIVHFVFYFVFATVWFLYNLSKTKEKKYQKIFIFSVSYGILMELCQAWFTTARTADWLDIVANTTGTLFGLALMYYLINVKKNKFLSN